MFWHLMDFSARSIAGRSGLLQTGGCAPHPGNFKVRHWGTCKQPLTRLCQPAGPPRGSRDSGTVGGDSCICIHLPVDLGDQDKGEAGAQRFYEPGPHPDGLQSIKRIPDGLRAVRVEAVPAKNPSFWTKETRIDRAYAKVGNFWLPTSNRSSSAIRLGSRAYFTIDYQDYQIAAAIPLGTTSNVAGYR